MEATWGGYRIGELRAQMSLYAEKLTRARSSSIALVLLTIMADKITRIAIVDDNRCKPKRCAQECKKVRVTFSPHRRVQTRKTSF
jgi:hypothetical protein